MQALAQAILAIVIVIGGVWFYFDTFGFGWGIGIAAFFLLAAIANAK
jgi:hypothetical protein